jgi:hypothetical protein
MRMKHFGDYNSVPHRTGVIASDYRIALSALIDPRIDMPFIDQLFLYMYLENASEGWCSNEG